MSHPLPAKPTTVRTPPIPTLVPAALNPSAALLLSALALPAGAAVVCRAWSGPDDAIDTARRHIADVAAGAPDVVSALASVVRPDVELSLWVFAVVAIDATAPRLDALDFTTLGLKEMTPSIARFELAYLYPCSAACARVSVPCAECTKPRTPTVCPLARTAPRLARPVRRPLRALYVLWTCAVRALAIERLSHPSLLAAGNGVLVCPPDEPTGEWGRPWSDPTRTLIHAHVHVSLAHPLPRPSAPTHLLIHLVPQTTTLLPVLSTPSVPGTPVLLLPLCTPAYAVAPYTGPTPHGFLQSLAGRGIPPSAAASTCILVWLPLPSSLYATATSPANMNALPTPSATTPAAGSGAGARGMYAIWPRALCVADTAASAIDISRLPGAPVGLTGTTLAMPHSKPRRFPMKTPKLSRPIALAQPSNQAPLGTALTSAQPLASAGAQPPSVDTDPAMSALANTAASLIDAVVRAREREKEKQRARMERARSGSAVPIPSLSGVGLGAGTGPSTPVESLSATSSTATVPPSLQIQTQTQTQTPSAMSAMYMSPPDVTPIQQHTPVHHFSSASTNPGAATSSVPDFISPAGSDTTLGIGMDLFGDQDTAFSEGYVSEDAEFGIEADVGGAFGADAFGTSGAFPYDSTGGSSIPYHSGGSNSAVGASTYPTRPYEPELYEDLWNGGVVKVEDQKVAGTGIGVIQAEDDNMDTFGEDDFDFLDSWGPSASGSVEGGLDAAIGMDVTIDTMPNLDGMDLDLGAGVGPTSPPMSSSTCTPTPTIQTPKSRTEPKPYFPLTPPAEKSHDPGGGKKGWLEPLQFTQKFEGVDGKYRGLDGKFAFRLGGSTLPGTGGKGMAAAAGTSIAGATRGGSGAAGTAVRTAQPSTEFPSRSWSLGSLVEQSVYGSTLAYSAARLQSQAQTQPRSRAQSQSQYQLSTQFSSKPQLQLSTPHPSPGTLRRLRAGYVGLTNPSAKRIRTLKLTHTKPATGAGTGTRALSIFARDWETGDLRMETKLRRDGDPSSPTATTTLSDAEMDTDSDDSDADGRVSIATGPGFSAPSRGTSPPLSASVGGVGAGPPGPSLLLALFRTSALASGILGEVLLCLDPREPKTPAPGPISVPTPVSPGDVLEPSKATLEGIANILAREAVENWAWGVDAGVCVAAIHAPAPSRAELMLLGTCLSAIAPTMTVARLTSTPKVEMVSEVLTDRAYPHLPRLEKLRPPKLSVGHSGQVAQMSVPALRFWDKIGLEPVGGPKNVLAFAVYEAAEGKDTSDEDNVITRWLESLGQMYQSRKLGKHTPGVFGGAQNGVLKVRLENMAEVLMDVIMKLPGGSSYTVFYIILPQRVLSNPKFQSVFSGLKSNSLFSTTSHYFEYNTIHLIPSSLVFNRHSTPFASRQRLECIALGVYDRIPRTIARRVRRTILPPSHPDQTLVQVPAFTLARPLAPRFRFSMGWPDGQREVMDRHMFLHIAYGFSKSRQWLGAACVDERGEAYETKLWRIAGTGGDGGPGEANGQGRNAVESDFPTSKAVAKVWAFAMRFAKRAAIEWRLVFCRMGLMDADELEAWGSHTSNEMTDTQMGLHVSVLSFDHTSGLTQCFGLAPSFKATSAPPGPPSSLVIDLTANDYLVLPGFDNEICINPDLSTSIEDIEFGFLPLASAHFLRVIDTPVTRPMGKIPEPGTKADEPPTITLSSQLHLLHVALTRNSSLWKSGGDPWRELLQSFYSLTALTQTRLPSLDPLPVHLAMLTVINNVAESRDLIPVEPTVDSA